jgi:hypothetical protein
LVFSVLPENRLIFNGSVLGGPTSVLCRKNEKLVARFPSVDAAARYIAPKAGFSEKYVRNSLYRALKSHERFPPFSDYFWERDEITLLKAAEPGRAFGE